MIPLWTTTIEVTRVPWPANTDPYDIPPATVVVAAGVHAHLSAPGGNEQVVGGSQERIDRHLDCSVVDLRHTDRVKDMTTGVVYDVVWAQRRTGLGLDRTEAGLRLVEGLS